MTVFKGRVESRVTVPSGGASVSATIANGAGAKTATVAAGDFFLTSAGGVSSLITAFQTALNAACSPYPTTAATAAAAIGYGDFTSGACWLMQEASGSLSAAFGAPSLAAVSSPTYQNAGTTTGDYAIGFNSANDAFSGGDVCDVTATDDLIVAWVGYVPAAAGGNYSVVSKYDGANGWQIYLESGTGNVRFQGVNGGVALFNADAGNGSYHGAGWHVGIAVIDRSTGKARIGTRSLAGTTTVSAEATTAATSTAGTAALRLGDLSSSPGTAPIGTYLSAVYVVSGSSVATGLSANLEAALTTFANAINAAWTVSLETATGTGLVSINWSGYATPTWSLSWTSTDLRNLLGFTANISSVTTTQTGTEQARSLWFPDCPLSIEGDPDQAPRVTDLRTTISPTGNVLGLVGNSMYRHRGVTWSHVPIARVWESAVTYANASFETFAKDALFGLGHSWMTAASPLQIYYDKSGTQTAVGYTFNSSAGMPGWSILNLNSVEPKKSVADWTGLFRIEFGDIVGSGS